MTDIIAAKRELVKLLEEKARRRRLRKFFEMFPEEGQFSRFAYPKHMEFFGLGSKKPYRALVGANGSGKSIAGSFETTAHLTGKYPAWWAGHKFSRPIVAWACGEDFKAIRESLQPTLLGKRGEEGTGMIPGELLIDYKYRSAPADSLDYVKIKHVTGGESYMVVKSYEEGRKSFQASDVDWIWLDEEPKWDIYSECISRFRGHTKDGQLIQTFTPLSGITDVVMEFLPQFKEEANMADFETSGRATVVCTVNDVGHIDEEERRRKAANYKPHERNARLYGDPTLAEGKVFTIDEELFVIDPIKIPNHYAKIYGMDVGDRTAAVWLAHDRDNDIVYVTSEHYMEGQLPPVHAAAVKARGVWIPGEIDTASHAKSPTDGENLFKMYKNLGLLIRNADKSVESGIYAIFQRMVEGRLKIFSNCQGLLREIRLYRRDKNGKIVKISDDRLDCLRYGINGLSRARLQVERDTKPKMAEQTFGIFG
jgi:phage terminase large subunit-like protein